MYIRGDQLRVRYRYESILLAKSRVWIVTRHPKGGVTLTKKNKLFEFAKDFSYTFTSNIFSALVTAGIIFVLPRFIGVEQYGYYQLYLFYSSFVNVSYFGWTEGIYLRLGGQYYELLDRSLYCTQFWLLWLYEVILFSLFFLGSLQIVSNVSEHIVIGCMCVAAVAMCLRWYINSIFQATARLKELATLLITERLLVIVGVGTLLLLGYRGFEWIIWVDVGAKYIALLIGVWYCRDFVFSKLHLSAEVFREVRENISAGVRLMLASLCSSLIISVVRYGVQLKWDIATFSRVSLTLSASNAIVMAINAVALVVYPMLRRTSDSQRPAIYSVMRTILMGMIFGGLVFYYPAAKILSAWLPQYTISIRYAAIIFPVCVYECKMSLLVNTYYKTLRLEGLLMKCNMATLALSVILTVLSTAVLHNVTMAIISVLICLVFRGIVSELLLAKHIAVEVKRDIVLELGISVAFIICNWFFKFTGMLIYAGCYLIYLLANRNDIKSAIKYIRSMA